MEMSFVYYWLLIGCLILSMAAQAAETEMPQCLPRAVIVGARTISMPCIVASRASGAVSIGSASSARKRTLARPS